MTYPIPQIVGKAKRYKDDPKYFLRVGVCVECKTEFYVSKRYPAQRFCTRKCGFKAMTPPGFRAEVSRRTARKRGDALRGRGKGKSYTKLNGRHAHRVVAEQKIGRPLRKGEIVHHRDENKQNYSPDNLEVLSGQSEHMKIHFAKRRKNNS